ncbi:GGDEF domain-containing protein [Paucisalibacillus sp. EB02]|uniref:GGDEF domain-containing protein n=1 Tax=Paucisalibacillus sp. EB02 TaxID=1347087 RepID=UPI0005A73673|nr:GGDEF domain-containing protein [Paucisalibacillus sp. EB02]
MGIKSPRINFCSKYKELVTILNIDIFNFKCMNNNYGHEYGDQILQEFSNSVLHSIKKNDLLFRWGGDEFLIVLQNANLLVSEKFSNWLNQTMNMELRNSIKEIDVNLSIGYPILREDWQTFDKLVSIADNNMYEVKALFKN